MPRRRAIVAPRFGKWARVTETSIGRKPTRAHQLPRLVFSVPCSGIRSWRRGNTLFHHRFKLCYLISRQTRRTGRTGVTRISPSYHPGSSSACQPVSLSSPSTPARELMHEQNSVCFTTFGLPALLSRPSIVARQSLFVCQTIYLGSELPGFSPVPWRSTPTFPVGVRKLGPSRGGHAEGIPYFRLPLFRPVALESTFT